MRFLRVATVFFLAWAFAATANNVSAQSPAGGADVEVVDSDTTQALFQQVMDAAREEALHEQPLGAIMQAVGLQFLDKPYVAGMLDEDMDETLVVDLDGYDCVTFVESVLALSRGIADEDYSYEGFTGRIQEQRYRDGVLDGYCSRLHYFTEWVANNEERGLVEDISRSVGGERFEVGFDFMSENRESYPQIATSDSLFEGMRAVEADLAELEVYHMPEATIHEAYDDLQAGDVIAITTDIPGLDVAHTGLVYRDEDGSVGLLHASLDNGVIVSPDLQTYVQNNARQVGIVVARPADPRATR